MRLPFLQLEADLLGQQGQVAAGMLRATPAQLIGHVALLRAYVLGHSRDGEVTGVVTGQSAARALALAAGWSGDPEDFIAALADPAVGLLERLPDGIRVRGMEPYEKARRKSEASKERVRKSRETRRLRATRANVPDKKKTEKKTETDSFSPTGAASPADDLPDAAAGAQPVADGPVFSLAPTEAPAKPTKASKPPRPEFALYENLEASRRANCERLGVAFIPSRWDGGRVAKVLGAVVKESAESQALFEEAWGAYCEDPIAVDREPPFSLDWFMKSRSRYEGRALKAVAS